MMKDRHGGQQLEEDKVAVDDDESDGDDQGYQ